MEIDAGPALLTKAVTIVTNNNRRSPVFTDNGAPPGGAAGGSLPLSAMEVNMGGILDLFSKEKSCRLLVNVEGKIAEKYQHYRQFLIHNHDALNIISQ